MKWMVTGGAGYIGAHVTREIIQSNRVPLVLDDFSTGKSERIPSGVNIETSTLLNLEQLFEVFSKNEIGGVIHLAAKKQVGESVKHPDYYWLENVIGFENLLSVMGQFGVKNLVFSSSASVYGQPDLRVGSFISEDVPCNPINPYGETKLEGERLAQEYARKYGASVIALRYFNAAGAGRKDLGDIFTHNLIPIVFEALDRGERPVIFGNEYDTSDGTCIRDYVHVQDLAEAHIAALDLIDKSGSGFERINVGTGVGASVLEVIETISQVAGKKIEARIVDRRDGDPASLVADVKKAKEVLNWSSKKELYEIVSSAWEAWQFR
jgi:UDP-glucose 4-epimerase